MGVTARQAKCCVSGSPVPLHLSGISQELFEIKSTERQQLAAVFPEDPGLIPSTYTLAHNCKLQSQGIQNPPSGLLGMGHACGTHTNMQLRYPHT